MKQILQNLSSGETLLADVPAPKVRAGHLLIETESSLISLGTERMLIDFGRANWIDKARQQPEKVNQVLQKIKTDGFLPTLEVVKAKLDAPLPLGYCNAGRVVEVGPGVEGFQVGDRVVSNSPHAEVVCAPKNLCAKIPDGVEAETASFAVLSAIALQGIRLVSPTLGETVVVTGLGLIGQLAVQLLVANGCQVIGLDFDGEKCKLAERFGAKTVDLSTGADPVKAALSLTRERGVDAVLITASTKSDEPIHQAATMCRKRGRIVLVGVVGMKMQRADFYEKELTFQVSCAYGPGRYDPAYEAGGNDYPHGFVRWTEQRNFEAALGLMADGKIHTRELVTHRYRFDQALEAYANVGDGNPMGIALSYPTDQGNAEKFKRSIRVEAPPHGAGGKEAVGLIGAGSFAGLVILPALAACEARLVKISSGSGVSAAHLGKKFGFQQAVSDNREILGDPDINTVFVTTRHANHGALVLEALKNGKHVFVEKPLCIHQGELEDIGAFLQSTESPPLLMVGFNRRFSPLIAEMRRLTSGRNDPVSMVFHVNAGIVPRDHWSQTREEGGGRILGEACHFIDTLRYLAGCPLVSVNTTFCRKNGSVVNDIVSIHLTFEDGSMGTVHYFGNGHKSLPREQLDLYCNGGILRMENFRVLRGYGWPGFKAQKLRRQDKGHRHEVRVFLESVRTGAASPIPPAEILEVTRASFEADAQSGTL